MQQSFEEDQPRLSEPANLASFPRLSRASREGQLGPLESMKRKLELWNTDVGRVALVYGIVWVSALVSFSVLASTDHDDDGEVSLSFTDSAALRFVETIGISLWLWTFGFWCLLWLDSADFITVNIKESFSFEPMLNRVALFCSYTVTRYVVPLVLNITLVRSCTTRDLRSSSFNPTHPPHVRPRFRRLPSR